MAVLPLGIQQLNGGPITKSLGWRFGVLLLAIPGLALWVDLCLAPLTASQIKYQVESFDNAPFASASWQHWEIPARWAIDSNLEPELSKPRRLLAQEIAGEQNPFVLGVAFRLGLVDAEQIGQLKDYQRWRNDLIPEVEDGSAGRRVFSLEQKDWVIRAAVLRNDLSTADRDYLQRRLNLDWVRSYLRTKAFRPGEERWMAPVTLDRLNRLPGIKPVTWFRILYYESSLLAALVLVAMCIYATLSAPKPTV